MSAIWCCCASMLRRIRPCTPTVISRISGTAITSTSASGPASSQVAAMNSAMKGRSLTTDIEAEAENSRTTSSWAMWCAKEPAESGRCSSRSPSDWRISTLPSARSARRPAWSIRWLRSWRATRSKPVASSAPMASDHSVRVAWCGMTRS